MRPPSSSGPQLVFAIGQLAEPIVATEALSIPRPDVFEDAARIAPLVLDADTGIVEASEAMLRRPPAHRYEDLVVSFPGGELGRVSVGAVMRWLAELSSRRAVHDPLTGLGNRA